MRTGDGLLLTIAAESNVVAENVRNTFAACLKVVNEFSSFCSEDAMINFEVPNRIGIGLSRGPVCRLVSGTKTLDCSGKVLNLASRLMDFARPSGIVFDTSLGFELLDKSQRTLLGKDAVYVRGISGAKPVDIYVTKDLTKIPQSARQPPDDTTWGKRIYTKTFAEWKADRQGVERFIFTLPSKPSDPLQIEACFAYRGGTGKEWDNPTYTIDVKVEYILYQGKPRVVLDKAKWDGIMALLQKEGLQDNSDLQFRITYATS